MIDIIATIVLPLTTVDLRREPRIMGRLEEEVRQALHRLKISTARERLLLPVIGEVIVKFSHIPKPSEDVRFHINFSVPAFDEAEVNVISDDDKKIFYEAKRLPLQDWKQYWERIYVDDGIKNHALNYCLLAQTFRKYDVSRMALAQHRIMIFYGPPGTGKTTLVRGLANKVADELLLQSTRSTIYVEIKAHALSSVDLGGSPKLVAQAFGRVEELATTGLPVICFIDEVESLLTNRTMTLNDTNPVDVFRAVNAVFQQIDRLAERPNVYTFATSNLPKAIDRAFFDRADMLFYIDLPDAKMRYLILCDIFAELNTTIQTRLPLGNHLDDDQESQADWKELLAVTDGVSGRHLRKLVLEAMANKTEIALQPRLLALKDIIAVARKNQERMKRDMQHGGSYEYAYSDVEGEIHE